jgi:signal transduction histidine kinase
MPNDPIKRRALARAMQQAAMAELMAVAAHEVNQPLAAMVANAGAGLRWLGRDPAQLDEARAAFQRIADDGRRAGDLLRRIRMQASGAGAESVLDVRTLVDEAWSAATEMTDTAAIELDLRVDAGAFAVRGEPAALELAVLNLMLNGIEAMQASGTLTLEAAAVGPSRVAIHVRDTGPGFPAEEAERIFQPFESTTGGLGMGLPVSRAIVDAHGGNLEARRDAGLTTFTVFLPTTLRAP